MPNEALTFTDTGFPSSTFSGSTQQLINAFLQYLGASINTTNLILGKYGGTEPVTDVGPWVDNRVWKSWNGTDYSPMLLRVGSKTNYIQFAGTFTGGAKTLTLQDKTGIIALLSDITGSRVSINLATTTPAHQMDWSASGSFYESINADGIVYTFINSLPGQKVMMSLTVVGAHDPTWPDTVQWPGGVVPPQTHGGTDVYLFKNIAGTIYGEQIGTAYA